MFLPFKTFGFLCSSAFVLPLKSLSTIILPHYEQEKDHTAVSTSPPILLTSIFIGPHAQHSLHPVNETLYYVTNIVITILLLYQDE